MNPLDGKPDSDPIRLTLREENDRISDFLLKGQRFLMKHPQASRAILMSLVEEGRRFAGTPEGQRWMEGLAASNLVKRGAFIWEAYGLDLLLESEPVVTPSAWLDLVLASIANPDLEGILSMLIVEEMRSGNVVNL